jgi:hypothetical protein
MVLESERHTINQKEIKQMKQAEILATFTKEELIAFVIDLQRQIDEKEQVIRAMEGEEEETDCDRCVYLGKSCRGTVTGECTAV